MSYLKALTFGLILSLTVVFALPQDVRAQSASCPWPGCYAGYSLPFMYSCTCDPFYNWMVFFPFHTLGTISTAALAVPSVVMFTEYSTSPAQKSVGTYIPGMQGCYIYVVYGCVPLPVYGTVYEYTGVSLPGPFY